MASSIPGLCFCEIHTVLKLHTAHDGTGIRRSRNPVDTAAGGVDYSVGTPRMRAVTDRPTESDLPQ